MSVRSFFIPPPPPPPPPPPLLQLVLGCEVREKGAPHNCLDDARAAMKLVLALIEHGIDDDILSIQEDVSIGFQYCLLSSSFTSLC